MFTRPTTILDLREWLDEDHGRYAAMRAGVGGESVVVTGTCPGLHRSNLYAMLAVLGLDVQERVTRGTTMLLAFDPGRRTGKLRRRTGKLISAKDHGTPIVDEKHFVSYLLAAALIEGMGATRIPTTVADIEPLRSLT